MILAGPVAERRVEDLIDVLRYELPLGEHPEVNALPSPHARFVGEAHHAVRELGANRGWDLDALEAAYRQVVEADYRFNGVDLLEQDIALPRRHVERFARARRRASEIS